MGTGFGEGWGKQLIGPNQAIPPQFGWVVSLNLLGSPFGSTSASMMPLSTDNRPVLNLSLEDLARGATSAMRALGISKATVKRDWAVAKAWMAKELKPLEMDGR